MLSTEFIITAFGSVITVLLGVIAWFLNRAFKSFDIRMSKMEERQNKHSDVNDDQTAKIAEHAKEITALQQMSQGLARLTTETSEHLKLIRSDFQSFNNTLLKMVIEKSR
jgi:hypothetical protein